MFHNILVVCSGNICRSPVAAALLQQVFPDKLVSSAGLAVEASGLSGREMDATARKVAEAQGLSCPPHSARQLTSSLASQADIILVMETHHRREIAQRFPVALAKTFLLGNWLEKSEVDDPHRKSEEAFLYIHQHLAQGCESWIGKL